jgi:hypothetical protein
MTRQTHRILIGAQGWQHEAWQDSFYPEELPSEWRLGFYNNEFPLVVVTDRERENEEELVEQIAESREDMLALLIVNADPASDPQSDPAISSACRLLTQVPHEKGLVLQVDPALGDDPADWLTQLLAVTGELPVCIDASATLDDRWRAALTEKGIGWCWNEHNDQQGLAVGPLSVMRVAGDMSPKQIRERIEAALAINDEEHNAVLLFAGEPPDIEAMRQAKTMEELM